MFSEKSELFVNS